MSINLFCAQQKIEKDRYFNEYLQAKKEFKSITQAYLKNGHTPETLRQTLGYRVIQDLDQKQESNQLFLKKLDEKINRYYQKLNQTTKADTRLTEEGPFTKSLFILKRKFSTLHLNPKSVAIYQEFRSAKKLGQARA